jgi:hypothetical protein
MEEVLQHMALYLAEHPERKPPPPLKKLFCKVIPFFGMISPKDVNNKIEMAVAHKKGLKTA